ncbi:hypothetical protein HY029_05895 [Candidatus Gottesmanbacteria bacterium]|nr:hypothetical protein [Candidatus Gottesmanbacteria bacterium]
MRKFLFIYLLLLLLIGSPVISSLIKSDKTVPRPTPQNFANIQGVETTRTIPSITLQPTQDPDPLIDCQYTNCGSIRIKKSLCMDPKGYVCCQIGNNWTWYASRDKCNQDQIAADPDPLITCNSKTGNIIVKKSVCSSYTDCPDGNGGFIFESQGDCKKLWDGYAAQLNQKTQDFVNALDTQSQLQSQLIHLQMKNASNQIQQSLQPADWSQYKLNIPPTPKFEIIFPPCPTDTLALTGEVLYHPPCPQP